MRYVGQPAHLVYEIHRFLGRQVGLHATRDEESDDLALTCFDFFPDDSKFGGVAREVRRALDRVVVGWFKAVEAAFMLPGSQLRQWILPGVRIVLMVMPIDAMLWKTL